MRSVSPEPLPRAAWQLSRTWPGGGTNDVEPGAIITLVLWLSCAAVGVLGLVLPYPRLVQAPPAFPLEARLVNVDLVKLPAPVPESPRSETEPLSAVVPTRPAAPQIPALVPMAAPPATVTFVLPPSLPPKVLATTQTTRAATVPPTVLVTTQSTRPAAVPSTGSATALGTVSEPHASGATTESPGPAVEPLTLGQGEGKQPLPEYPRPALRAGQEGIVRIGLLVGEDGRVVAAEVVVPSPWPLLDEAALRVVRQRWRFAPGTLRRYEAPIHFQLQK